MGYRGPAAWRQWFHRLGRSHERKEKKKKKKKLYRYGDACADSALDSLLSSIQARLVPPLLADQSPFPHHDASKSSPLLFISVGEIQRLSFTRAQACREVCGDGEKKRRCRERACPQLCSTSKTGKTVFFVMVNAHSLAELNSSLDVGHCRCIRMIICHIGKCRVEG